jgi:hypothetical protein
MPAVSSSSSSSPPPTEPQTPVAREIGSPRSKWHAHLRWIGRTQEAVDNLRAGYEPICHTYRMDYGLQRIAASQPGRFTTEDAHTAGLIARDLSKLVRSGTFRRLRRGLYARAAAWPNRPDEQHIALTSALLDQQDGRWAASHHSAALLHGLPVWGCPLGEVHMVPVQSSRRGRSSAVMMHSPLPAEAQVHTGGGVLVRPEVAALQIAMRFGVEAGVVTLDAGLHAEVFDRVQLAQALDLLNGRKHVRWARRAAALADSRSESVGESRLRFRLHLLGFAGLEPQVEIRDRRGFVGRVDLYDAESFTAVEFDGLVKYRGGDGAEVVVKEKRREDRLRAVDIGVARFVWRELDDMAYLKAETQRAMRQARPRSTS